MGYEMFYFTNTLPQIKREKKHKRGREKTEVIICESDFDVRWIEAFLDRTADKSSHCPIGGQY